LGEENEFFSGVVGRDLQVAKSREEGGEEGFFELFGESLGDKLF